MSDEETWVDIPDFPGYAVSDRGRIMNLVTGHIKIPSRNQRGIAHVLMIRDHHQHRRAVAPIVARAFLDPPKRSAFDTPINLNADRMDNRAENLVWRPRWFAVGYHAQFRKPIPFDFKGRIRLAHSSLVFDSVRDCAMRYGLLEREIIMSAHNKVPVFPTWQYFELA